MTEDASTTPVLISSPPTPLVAKLLDRRIKYCNNKGRTHTHTARQVNCFYAPSRRRSKSLGDLTFRKSKPTCTPANNSRNDRLHHYNDVSTPTSPIVSFGTDCAPSTLAALAEFPPRRHSSCMEPSTRECLRLATIYGWVTANSGCHQYHKQYVAYL